MAQVGTEANTNFTCHLEKNINGFEVKLFEVDLENEQEKEKIENFLCDKISKMNIHQELEQYLQYLDSPMLNPELKEKIREEISRITSPREPARKWLSVKRSWITEFMSQFLLENEFNCIFSESLDKRINIKPIDIDKHASGIDVTGLQENNEGLKFVACEVKSSSSDSIPCRLAEGLYADIQKAYNDENERLSREILDYVQGLGHNAPDDEALIGALDFLLNLIGKSSSKDEMLKNVVFFPFLIRNNPEIVEKGNLNDFQDFEIADIENIDLQGIIWSFNTDIDEFCDNIYQEAVNNG